MESCKLVNLCILCSLTSLLILTPTVFSQKYSFNHKDYFLIREFKSFDQAVDLCGSRGERLVSIKGQAENDFIWTTIVEPSFWAWLGATNIIGTNNFTWLADGSDVTTNYTNWYGPCPNKDVNRRNAIVMRSDEGTWSDMSADMSFNVICERISVLDSQLTEPSDQKNAKIEQLDEQLKTVIKSVQEMKESNDAEKRNLKYKFNMVLEIIGNNGQVTYDHQKFISSLQQSLANFTQSMEQKDLLITELVANQTEAINSLGAKFIQVAQRLEDMSNKYEQLQTNFYSRLHSLNTTVDSVD